MKWIKNNATQRLLTLLMIATLFSFGTIATFAETPTPPPSSTAALAPLVGEGFVHDPYQINSCEDLQRVNENLSANYILVSTIDCSNSASMNNGAGFIPLGTFTGEYFDGRNFNINSLTISSSSVNSLGLFQSVSENSKIANLGFSDLTINNQYVNSDTDSISTGSLAGMNEGTLYNVRTVNSVLTGDGLMGAITGYNSGTVFQASAVGGNILTNNAVEHIAGGITGYNTGTISNVANSINIDLTFDATAYCGGIAGVSAGGVVEKSFASGRLDCRGASSLRGGIVGQTSGNAVVDLSLSTSFGGDAFQGGLIASNQSNSDLTNSSFDVIRSGTNQCDDVSPNSCIRVNPQLIGENYFKGNSDFTPVNIYDQSEIWVISDGLYPWVKTRDLTPMSSTKFQITDGSDSNLTLNWTGDPTTPIDGYIVERSQDQNQTWVQVTSTSDNSASVNLPDPNKVYFFRVKAFNSSGVGYASPTLTVGLTPGTQTNLSVGLIQPGSIAVSWTDNSVAPNLANHFEVQYRKVGANDWLTYGDFRIQLPKATITDLETASEYEIRVDAVNWRGHSQFTNTVTARTSSLRSYEIANCIQLQDMNKDVYGEYKLIGDIDCKQSATWNNGKGFIPVGNFDQPFVGSLDGQGHSISDLTMVRNDAPGGLFGFANDVEIKDLKLDGGLIDHSVAPTAGFGVFNDEDGRWMNIPTAGSLVGIGVGLTISNVETNVPVYTSRAFGMSGGVVGALSTTGFRGVGPDVQKTTFTNVKSAGDVEGYIAGGIASVSFPTYLVENKITPQNIDGAVVQLDDIIRSGNTKCSQVCSGGIGASAVELRINHMTNTGSVSSDLTTTGLAFDETNFMLACSFQTAGGIVGLQGIFPLSILNSTNSGTISSTTYDHKSTCQDFEGGAQGIGGLLGSYVSPVDGFFQLLIPNFDSSASTLGQKKLTIAHSTSSGQIVTNVNHYAGGVAGFIFADAIIDDVSSSGNVTSNYLIDPMFNLSYVNAASGGLIGKIMGGAELRPNLANSSGLPKVSIVNAQVKNSFATGNVYSNNVSGGFIGSFPGLTNVSHSYASGNVTGVFAGGFIGASASSVADVLGVLGSANIEDTYATGNVFARDMPQMLTVAGGYLGLNAFVGELNISNSYSAGAVRIENNASTNRSVFGGFAGTIINVSAASSALPMEVSAGLSLVGLNFHNDLNLKNIFTVSTVPPSTDLSGVLPYFAHKEDVTPGIMSGSMLGASLEVTEGDFQVVDPTSYTDNIYVAKNIAGTNKCGFTANNFVTSQGSTIPTLSAWSDTVCKSANSESSFMNSTVQAPLNKWDFQSDVWHKHANGYPSFSADPVVPLESNLDNPLVQAPSYDPPKVSAPVIKTIPKNAVNTVVKYFDRVVKDPDPVKNGFGAITKVLDTPTLARALSVPLETKVAKDSSKSEGMLAGIFNLLLKYLKYIVAAILGGAVVSYHSRKKKPRGPSNGSDGSDDDSARDTADSYSCAGVGNTTGPAQNQVSKDVPYRSWDGPPQGYAGS